MSTWRTHALLIVVRLAALPIVAIVGTLLFGAIDRLVDLTKNIFVFFLFALPFLVCWMLADRWVIRRIEELRVAKGQNVQ